MTVRDKLAALDRFQPGTGAYRIAEALLDSDDWISRSDLAAIGGVAGTSVPTVARRLRFECGVDVKVRRVHDSGQAEYRVSAPQPAPIHLVTEDEQVAA
jgi:biotin operon repressor